RPATRWLGRPRRPPASRTKSGGSSSGTWCGRCAGPSRRRIPRSASRRRSLRTPGDHRRPADEQHTLGAAQSIARAGSSPRWKTPTARPALLRLRRDAQVRLGRLPPLRELLLGVLVADRAGDDDVLSLLPVGRRRHLVLG